MLSNFDIRRTPRSVRTIQYRTENGSRKPSITSDDAMKRDDEEDEADVEVP